MTHLLLISETIDKIISAFCWMLIHSLWQGLLLAIVGGVALTITKKSSSVYRYNILVVLFAGFIFIGCLTFYWEWDHEEYQTITAIIGNSIHTNVSSLFSGNIDNVKQSLKAFADYLSVNAPMIVLLWFIFFLFKSIKMIGSVVYSQRVKNYRVFEPSEFWTNKITVLSKKIKIKKTVKLLQSGYIKMPVVIGHIKPVILIPIGIMTNLSVEQVEAILLHELAHIRRSDYFVNFLQNLTEVIFFFNPGLLWISSLLREERENCCDDIALEQTQDKKEFIRALISFKEHELYGSNYAIAFPGKKNQLIRRVGRILNNKNKTFGFGERVFFIAGTLLLLVMGTSVAVACINRYTNTALKQAPYGTVSVIKQRVPSKQLNKDKKIRMVTRRVPTGINRKMRHGIPGINAGKELSSTVWERKEPVAAVLPANKNQLLTDKLKADIDQIQAKSRQDQAASARKIAMTDKVRANLDQEQALRNQATAKSNQAKAIKNEIQAKLNQQQAMKEKADADAAGLKLNYN